MRRTGTWKPTKDVEGMWKPSKDVEGVWKPSKESFWQPKILQLLRPPVYTSSEIEPLLEHGMEYQDLDEETKTAANLEQTTETSKETGPIMFPSIRVPALVPRRGLLVLRWNRFLKYWIFSLISESGSSQVIKRQGVGLVSIVSMVRWI